MFVCDTCNEEFNDEILLLIHREIFHNTVENEERESVIKYAPPAEMKVEVVAEAVRSKVKHFQIKNSLKYNMDQFLFATKQLVVQTLKQELDRLNFIKFGLLLDATFTNVQDELSSRGFITKNKSVLNTTDIEDVIEEMCEELNTKVTEHEGRGSGWSLLSIDKMFIRVHKHGYGDRGSSYIPLPARIEKTKSCINVLNNDNECFRYAMLAKFVDSHANRPDRRYKNLNHKYNFRNIEYPVSFADIKMFEKQNPATSINIFGLDKSNNVYPLRLSPVESLDHTDLLLIKDGDVSHYVYIKDFERLVSKQLTKLQHRISVCKRCFCYAVNKKRNGGNAWLREHQRLCGKKDVARICLPSHNRSRVQFSKVSHQYRIPIVVYADFESSLLPLDTTDADPAKRMKYQMHKPNSYCIMVKSVLTEDHLKRFGLTSTPHVYRGENAASKFMDHMYEIAFKVEQLYKCKVSMLPLTSNQLQQYSTASTCYLCKHLFSLENPKVRDHDHLTGFYRGAACNSCNLNYKVPRFVPVVLHNLSGYDAHFIVPELGRDDGSIDVLATTTERFISFSKKVGKIKLRFVDSFKFMSSSLLKLTENLQRKDLIETSKLVPADKMELVLRKGVFPYDYIDNLSKFTETCLPPADCFYNKLCEEDITREDYNHACRVWNELGMRTLGDYSDFYVKLDVTLLCDVMEEFRNTCINAYGLDPLHSYTSPGLAWQAMLKETNCVLDLLTDIDMLLMVESGVRGGLTQTVKRHVKANNKHLPNYESDQESIYLGYFDANNLYGWAMSNPLPRGDFAWIDPESLGDITQLPRNGDIGYILECDFQYPETIHDHHYDLPMLARSERPPEGKHDKLMMTLYNKERYVAHFWVVQQALQLGLKITKIHRVLQFSQSCWLKPYIESNTRRRAAATSSFQKDFFKLMNNAIFGKTLENKRKHKDVKLVTNAAKLEELVRQPNFGTSIIIHENLVAVCMKKTKVVMDRPLYVGMAILDISKYHMYDFHYNKMIKYYGRNRIGISYMDTDAFVYWIKTEDMYEDLRTFPYNDDFDFSDYPTTHPTYDGGRNKKVLGKFKDETNGLPIEEIVALMAKLYSMKILHANGNGEREVIKKAKGVKNLYLKKRLQFDNYKECLFEDKTFTAKFNNIRSYNHQLYSITETKKAISSNDDKRYTLQDKVHTLPYGHYSTLRIDE